mgnify:FL=1
MTSEREKMASGAWYCCVDEELDAMRMAARRACHAHATMDPDNRGNMAPELRALLGRADTAFIEAPFHCAYGANIHLSTGVYINTACVFLDTGRIEIGPGSMLGPGVHIYCADHHHDPALRQQGLERALPVSIGANVWIGGGAIILPGVQIGDDAIIGAGSVVTKDVAAGSRVVGNPARVLP